MALASPPAAGIQWHLSDLIVTVLLSLVLLVPLVFVAMPLLLASRWNLLILGVVLEAAAVLPAVAVVARWRGARHLWQFGLGRYPWKKGLLLGLVGGLGLFVLLQGLGTFLESCGAHLAPQRLLADTLLAQKDPGRLLIFLLVAAIVAPFWEEIFFRGLTYQVLRHRLGVLAGCLLSGALFALLHAEPMLLRLPIFLLGALLAGLYEMAGSLYVPIVAHAVANTLSTLLAYFGLT